MEARRLPHGSYTACESIAFTARRDDIARMTTAIEMGTTRTGEPGLIDLAELLATRLLVQGNSGSGKSHLLRRLLEQSAGWVQQVIIDPEGDFVTLADRYGHVVIEGERTEAELLGIAARVRSHDRPAAVWPGFDRRGPQPHLPRPGGQLGALLGP